MYHLLVRAGGWTGASDSFISSRIFEDTPVALVRRFKASDGTFAQELLTFPALFLPELNSGADQVGRVGSVSRIGTYGREATIEYSYDLQVPPIPMTTIQRLQSQLGIIGAFGLSRTYWSIKDIDLFRVLLRDRREAVRLPRIFGVEQVHDQEDDLVSVMMPFADRFKAVHSQIESLARSLGLRCLRADDIWDHDAIIQDIASLIARSRVVICDCSGKNANVFYEAGIAHALGKDVVLITQSEEDIPFDLRHLRYITYLNNNEGLGDLAQKLTPRLRALS